MIIDLCDLPDTCGFGQKHEGIIHGLAPREVYRKRLIAAPPVVSYTAFSPLPLRAVLFL